MIYVTEYNNFTNIHEFMDPIPTDAYSFLYTHYRQMHLAKRVRTCDKSDTTPRIANQIFPFPDAISAFRKHVVDSKGLFVGPAIPLQDLAYFSCVWVTTE